jgi:hypothetical protein
MANYIATFSDGQAFEFEMDDDSQAMKYAKQTAEEIDEQVTSIYDQDDKVFVYFA